MKKATAKARKAFLKDRRHFSVWRRVNKKGKTT